MAEETKTTATPEAKAPPAAKTLPSRETLQKHIASVTADTLKLAGTNKLNPYLFVKRNITPVADELAATKDITETLANKVLALKAAVLPKE